ncbi:MAG: hypothetical protein IM664_04755 [Phenylobacterium sp.]|uniref:hypothetical protein n=1 Tax=Phenylobacterium sp. TaxID=1871053 RepID=UPI0025FD7578|nr:hypothetical protein [Phenylobacterium sp.]MCA3713503.1 hypothetical protein [Phenylobacterium sp.]MCA3722478.1 hypothetical protein [Phenylobacterium sp.]MCA3726163.1 hypothetical protein [Phenylobacterium sp.]MCA3732794.1 hypothetical protein [Phenylobacterium sp.]MCA6239329.1 hypothetical protein [Phenylobacterium sp.]
MSNSHTTFVIGAGASHEVGLPLGKNLKDQIAKALDIQFEYFHQKSGDLQITNALRDYLKFNGAHERELERLIRKCILIKDNMKRSSSIDEYLDAHKEDYELVICGKIAIVKAILDAEANSKLQVVEFKDKFNENEVNDTWFNSFFQLIRRNISKSNLDSIFDNINVITFNYDRCIEHFLVQRLSEFYDIERPEAERIVRKLRIYHPYGQVGFLPWQNNGGVRFGEKTEANLLSIASEIKTFTERMDDKENIDEIKDAISESKRLVFLGFAYHAQNLNVIKPRKDPLTRKIYGTAFGISHIDQITIRNDLINMMTSEGNDGSDLDIQILEVTCGGFFDQFGRTLNVINVTD